MFYLNINIRKKMTLEVPIFRFNFSEQFNRELGYFAKLHKHEDRIDFKESWNEWTEENNLLIDEEKKRLLNLGYEGDIEDKMYKSVRYYFRKKPLRHEPVERCVRVVVSKDLLRQMDEHIENNSFGENYTPQLSYEDFCNQYSDLINDEFIQLNMKNEEIMQNKIKKTYKNRFYVIIRQKSKNQNKPKSKKNKEDEEDREIDKNEDDEKNGEIRENENEEDEEDEMNIETKKNKIV